ncbi:hypothetical protein VUR80DRAFT_3304 [Thermomyces stellatus]
MLDRLQAWMASLSPKRNGEASLAIWVLGSVMTCLAVAFPLLGDNNINNYLFTLAFIIACLLFNALQLERVKTYGPYVLIFPVASSLPWPAIHGTPDLAYRIPPVVTLTTLLIWNAPTIASMLRTPRNNGSMGINPVSEPFSDRTPSRAGSLAPHQDVAALVRTFLWVNESTQPWSQAVYRQEPSSSGGLCSDSETSISLSEGTPSFWTGPLQRRYTDPTLVDDGLMLPGYTASLRSHVSGFNVGHHGSVRSMSPVYMEK